MYIDATHAQTFLIGRLALTSRFHQTCVAFTHSTDWWDLLWICVASCRFISVHTYGTHTVSFSSIGRKSAGKCIASVVSICRLYTHS